MVEEDKFFSPLRSHQNLQVILIAFCLKCVPYNILRF